MPSRATPQFVLRVSLFPTPRRDRTVGLLRRSIEEKIVMEGILLRGPTGSGKSALIEVQHIKPAPKTTFIQIPV